MQADMQKANKSLDRAMCSCVVVETYHTTYVRVYDCMPLAKNVEKSEPFVQ